MQVIFMAEGLMVEEKSTLTILVIEDNPKFAENAMEGLRGHAIVAVNTLEMAKELAKDIKFDVILSDVHVPRKDGEEPAAIVSEVLEICRNTGAPVCFVTMADHHGLLDLGDEGYVSLKATTQGRILQSEMENWANDAGNSEAEIFRSLKTASGENLRAGSKTPEIWSRALSMALNAMTKPTAIGNAMRKVGELGLDVVADKGLARVVPKK
jgi:CheY-like chemotaxis protein